MSFTNRIEVTDEAWTIVFSGAGAVQLQLASAAPVMIHVGTSLPVLGAPGLVLEMNELQEYVNNDLEDGDTVYVRAFDKPSSVTVVGTGSAP